MHTDEARAALLNIARLLSRIDHALDPPKET